MSSGWKGLRIAVGNKKLLKLEAIFDANGHVGIEYNYKKDNNGRDETETQNSSSRAAQAVTAVAAIEIIIAFPTLIHISLRNGSKGMASDTLSETIDYCPRQITPALRLSACAGNPVRSSSQALERKSSEIRSEIRRKIRIQKVALFQNVELSVRKHEVS